MAMPVICGNDVPLIEEVKRVESDLGARVGISAHDLETGRRWEYRADERFAMASTFKTLACAALLDRVDKSQENLDRRVRINTSDLVSYSPVTERQPTVVAMYIAETDASFSERNDAIARVGVILQRSALVQVEQVQ